MPIILPDVVVGAVLVAAALTDARFLEAASATPAAETATHAMTAAAITPITFRVICYPLDLDCRFRQRHALCATFAEPGQAVQPSCLHFTRAETLRPRLATGVPFIARRAADPTPTTVRDASASAHRCCSHYITWRVPEATHDSATKKPPPVARRGPEDQTISVRLRTRDGDRR
jgi:hypothetical protein